MRIGFAAALLWASTASAQSYYYNGNTGGSPYNATAYGSPFGAAGAYGGFRGVGVGPAPYTWVHPHLGYNVAPNTGVPNQPQVTGRVTPRIVRYVPVGRSAPSNRNPDADPQVQAVAATSLASIAPAATPNAEGFVTVPREKAGDSALVPVAARSGGVPPAPAPSPTARPAVRPIAYPTPLRAPPRNAVRSAYATPTQSRDGKADWTQIQ